MKPQHQQSNVPADQQVVRNKLENGGSSIFHFTESLQYILLSRRSRHVSESPGLLIWKYQASQKWPAPQYI